MSPPDMNGCNGDGSGSDDSRSDVDDTFSTASNQVVVLVDPYSTGCCIGQEMQKRGYSLVAVWTHDFTGDWRLHIPASCGGVMHYIAEVTEIEGETLEQVANKVRQAVAPKQVICCIAGGEAGVDYADALSEQMGCPMGRTFPSAETRKFSKISFTSTACDRFDKPLAPRSKRWKSSLSQNSTRSS
jgi:hypothetical protein